MILPKISIITVTYNCATTLQNTIDSVAEQKCTNIEYIVIDGASNDGTLNVIKANQNHITHWISEPDKGIYDAMNKGVTMSSGQYVFFLGGDDTLIEGTLQEIIPAMTDPNTLYYGDVILSHTKERYAGKFNSYKLIGKNICHQAIFYPRSPLQKTGFDLQYKCYADWVANMQLWHDGIKFEYLNHVISNFTVGGVSINGDKLFFKERPRLIKRYFGLSGLFIYYLRYKSANLVKKLLLRRNG